MSALGSPDIWQALAECLATLGDERFNAAYLHLIEKTIHADQCMVFSFKSGRPECYLSHSKRHKKTAINLAQKYLRHGFRNDPLQQHISNIRQTGASQIISLSSLKNHMSQAYYDAFFRSCGIGDKISVITSRKTETLLLNFYWFEENCPVPFSNKTTLAPFWQTIAQLAAMHFADTSSADLRSPLNSLSKREKDICEAILNGMTSDAIAWQFDISLNTVKTYRQRAYAKLGINSKAALFALCKAPANHPRDTKPDTP